MKTEYEVKILNINIEEIKKKLIKIGAKKHLERHMRRYVYNIDPNNQQTWIRLRDDGEKTQLTIKEISDNSITGTKELEINVSDFDKTHLILDKLGYKHKALQENKRESYKLKDIEFEIDSWPKIPPYLEIEGPSKEKVEEAVKLLGYASEDTTSMNTKKIYLKHDIDLDEIKELKFDVQK